MRGKVGIVLEASGLALLALVAVVAMFYTFDKRINMLDEGFIMYASERVSRGAVPYRDFFTLLSPGTYYLHALLFKLFGTSLMVGRWSILAVGIALPLVTYACARYVLPVGFALLAGLFVVVWGVSHGFVIPTYSWYASLLSMVALWMALRAQRLRWVRGSTILAGVFLGLTILFKQNFGAFATGAVLVFALVDLRHDLRHAARTLGLLVLAVAAVNAPFVIWIAAKGGFHDMVKDAIMFPIGPFRGNMAIPYPQLWPIFASGFTLRWPEMLQAARVAVAWVPVIYAVFGLGWLVSQVRRGLKTDGNLLILLFASFMILGAFPRADLGHVLFPMTAGFIVLTATLYGGVKLLSRYLGTLGTIVGVCATLLVCAPLVLAPILDTQSWNANATFTLDGWPRADGIKMQQWEAESAKQVLDQMEALTNPGDDVFVVPWAAMFYFLSGRENPTRYDLIIPGNFDAEGEQEMIDDLEAKKPRYVIHGFVWDVDGKRFEDYAPNLHWYIRSHYSSMYFVNQYEFLERDE